MNCLHTHDFHSTDHNSDDELTVQFIVLPAEVAVIPLQCLGNALQAEAVKLLIILGGDKLAAVDRWGRIAAVGNDDNAVTVSLGCFQSYFFVTGLCCSSNGIVHQIAKDRNQVDIIQSFQITTFQVVVELNPATPAIDDELIDHHIQHFVAAVAVVGIDHQLLILLFQNVIIGFLGLEPFIFAFDSQMLAFGINLVLICNEQKYRRSENNDAGNGQQQLNIVGNAVTSTDEPENHQTEGRAQREEK